jgi:hypothetical protein
MAYDNNGARIGAAGHFASRIVAALIAKGGIEPSEAAAADAFANLTSDCLAVLNGLEGAAPAAAANVIKASFPGTTEAEGSELRIIGGDGSPAPAWLYTAAAKAGVTAVFDNREDLADNPKLPWFRQAEPEVAKDDRKPFWPPRKR